MSNEHSRILSSYPKSYLIQRSIAKALHVLNLWLKQIWKARFPSFPRWCSMILCGTRSTPFPENFWEISHFETSFEGQPSIQNLVQTIMWPNSNGQKTNNKNLKIMSLPTCKSVFESYSMYHLNHHKSQDQKFIDTKTNVKWQTLEEFYLAAFQTLCDRPGPWPPDEDKNNGWDWCRLVSRKVTASIYYNINIPNPNISLYILLGLSSNICARYNSY